MIADRARSLRGPSEVTDLASSGPQRASQRGPAPERRLRDAAASTQGFRGISREPPIIASTRNTALRSLCAALFCLIVAGIPAAADWPQFLGPERNGVYRGPALAETWPAQGPRVAWRKTVGQGFAAPVVVQNRLILFHRVGAQEVVEALDATTGASVWRYQYRPPTATTSASTKDRARCRSSPTASSTRSAPKASFTPSTSPPASACGARTR